jgi:3-phenylpropionate/cinnamic acid dioxygenase small subunit
MGLVTGDWQDREQIRELYAQYSITLDVGDFERWLDCFTEDAVFDSPRFGHHQGHDGLRRFITRYKESLGGARTMHINANVSFQIEGERAVGGCYFVFFHCKDGRSSLGALDHYRDAFRKEGGIWRFEKRAASLDARPS